MYLDLTSDWQRYWPCHSASKCLTYQRNRRAWSLKIPQLHMHQQSCQLHSHLRQYSMLSMSRTWVTESLNERHKKYVPKPSMPTFWAVVISFVQSLSPYGYEFCAYTTRLAAGYTVGVSKTLAMKWAKTHCAFVTRAKATHIRKRNMNFCTVAWSPERWLTLGNIHLLLYGSSDWDMSAVELEGSWRVQTSPKLRPNSEWVGRSKLAKPICTIFKHKMPPPPTNASTMLLCSVSYLLPSLLSVLRIDDEGKSTHSLHLWYTAWKLELNNCGSNTAWRNSTRSWR